MSVNKKGSCIIIAVMCYITIVNAVAFNIEIIIPENFRMVKPGSDLLSTIKIIDIDNQGRTDVTLEYDIQSNNGEIILKKKETVAIETQATFVKIFNLPPNMKKGQYILKVNAQYENGKISNAEHSFSVGGSGNATMIYVGVIILGIGIPLLVTHIFPKIKKGIQKIRVKNQVKKMIKKQLR